MKSKLLLATVLLLAITGSAFANPVRTVFNLRMQDGRPISVMVDGVPQGAIAAQHEIINLTPGVHRLKIFTPQQHPFGWNYGAMIPVYRGSVEIYSDYAVYAFIDRFGKLVIEDYEALFCEPVPPVCNTAPAVNYPPHHGGNGSWNNGGNGNWNHGGNVGNNPNGWNNNYRMPMHPDEFSQLLSVIESKSFESTKQQIAMGAINNSYFTSEQIRQLLNVFTFESTKVEVAKKAYDRVVDPDKFYVVYNSFTFESSISDLVTLRR